MTTADTTQAVAAPAAAAVPPQPSEWRRGWPIVLSSTLGFGGGMALFMMTAGMFIAPMRAEYGWTMSQAAFPPIVSLIISLMMPLGGVAIDHFGPRRVAVLGLLLFAGAYIALALLPLNLALLYVIAACLGLFGWAGNSGPYVRVIASWFRRNTGAAFGLTMSGTSLAGIAAVPVAAWVMANHGWRAGYLTLTAIILLVILPVLLWLFRLNPDTEGAEAKAAAPATGQTLKQTFADARFWVLMLSLGAAALPMGAYLVHLQPLLRSQGFTLQEAAGYASLFALGIGVGRIGGGFLIDRLWDYGVAATVIALAAVGCFLIPGAGPQSAPLVVSLTVFAIGLSYGAEIDFGAYFTLKLFGLKAFSRIFGFKSLVVGGGVSLGGIMSSALFDLTGGYRVLGLVTGVMFLLAAATMLLLGVMPKPAEAASEPAR